MPQLGEKSSPAIKRIRMARFRQRKQELRALLLQDSWPAIAPLLAAVPGMEAVSPLLGFLLDGGLLKWRAVLALGVVVSRLAEEDTEAARTVMRRLLWHLNEDSGNIGWGIAESMGEILAQSPRLAEDYGRILLSYARQTGKADNYIDHGPLRRGVYWGIGRFALTHEKMRPLAVTLLAQGLRDDDLPARGVAAWALGQVALREKTFGQEWNGVCAIVRDMAGVTVETDVLQGETVRQEAVCVFAEEALNAMQDAETRT